jgi:hypothetical protein
MYNIIRGIPFTMRNKEGKNVYWMEVRGGGGHTKGGSGTGMRDTWAGM